MESLSFVLLLACQLRNWTPRATNFTVARMMREKKQERGTLKHCKKMHSEYSKGQQYGKNFGMVLDIACKNCGIIYSTPINMLSNIVGTH